jgi:hypothetical protein
LKHTQYSYTPVPCKPLKYKRMYFNMVPQDGLELYWDIVGADERNRTFTYCYART